MDFGRPKSICDPQKSGNSAFWSMSGSEQEAAGEGRERALRMLRFALVLVAAIARADGDARVRALEVARAAVAVGKIAALEAAVDAYGDVRREPADGAAGDVERRAGIVVASF